MIKSNNFIPEITHVDDKTRTLRMSLMTIKEWNDDRVEVNNTMKVNEEFYRKVLRNIRVEFSITILN